MKKIILTVSLALSLLLGYGEVAKASEVVDLGVISTEEVTEETVEENTTSTSGNTSGTLEDWANTDTTFGEDMVPNVKPENFFVRLYHKMTSALSGFQLVCSVILIFFFVIGCIMLVVSLFGQKNRVPWYLLALLIIAIMFICVIYAYPIVNSFKSWFMS